MYADVKEEIQGHILDTPGRVYLIQIVPSFSEYSFILKLK